MRNNNLAPRKRGYGDESEGNENANESQERITGFQDEMPGRPGASTTRVAPSKTLAGSPKSHMPISKAGGREMPKGKFHARRPGSKVVRSSSKNRTGKKYRHGGGKQPPTVAQKAKSFGGV